MSNKIKTVLWDMGGVILRTEDWMPRKELAAQYGMTLDEIHALVFNSQSANQASLGKIDEETHWKNLGNQLSIGPEPLMEFRERFWQGDRLDIELVDFIRQLKPTCTTGLLSNAWTGARQVLTTSKPCIDAFHVSIFSCEIGMAKPDRSIYNYILRLCATDPDSAIFVDDAVENIESADRLGMHGVLFKNTKQAVADVINILKTSGAIA